MDSKPQQPNPEFFQCRPAAQTIGVSLYVQHY
jgi:hypothetical protein